MAKIKYLVNNDPYESMRMAVVGENIALARFYHKFVELWGRMSTGNYGDTFDRSSAVNLVDGIEVYGNALIYLFKDGAAGFKYTRLLCDTIGLDYDELYSKRGDVDKFYIQLKSDITVDFSQTENIITSMIGVEDDLDALVIDRIVLTWVLDTEYDPDAMPGMSLSELRSASQAHINFNTGEFLEDADILDLKPVMTCYGLPSLASPEGDPVAITDHALNQVLTLFLKFTDMFDTMFETITVASETLPDRGDVLNTYHRYQYSVEFSFGSTVDEEGVVTNKIDWSPLSSLSFAETFVTHYAEAQAFTDAHLKCNDIIGKTGAVTFCSFDENPPASVIACTSIIIFLNEFTAPAELFHKQGDGTTFYYVPANTQVYMRYDKLLTMRKRDIDLAVMLAIKIGAVEKDDGWLGGSIFGKFLEMIFVVVVVVVAIVLTVILDNPAPLIIGLGLLYGAAKYTGMSNSGKQLAGVGIKVLSVASIAYGVYEIYNLAYGVAESQAAYEAAAAALEKGASEEAASQAGLLAMQDITTLDVITALGANGTLKLASSMYRAFNLLMPPDYRPESSDATEDPDEDRSAIYNVNTAYDFYDDIYRM